MDKRIKLLALAMVPTAALLLLPGCGGDDNASKSATESQMPASDTPQEPEPVNKVTAQEEIDLKTPGQAIESEVETAKDKAENEANKMEDTTEKMVDTTEEKAKEAEKSAGEMMEDMGEKMQK